jgi:carboxyl-terminal processing protease
MAVTEAATRAAGDAGSDSEMAEDFKAGDEFDRRHDRPGRAKRGKATLVAVCLLALLPLACSRGTSRSTPSETVARSTTSGAAATAVSPPSSTSVAAATPAPPSASRVETVKIAFDLLLDRYYKPLKSSDLLQSAWKGATAASGSAAEQISAPKLIGDKNSDWQSFRDQYEQLYGKAAASVDGTAVAFGAVDAMASGLHDDHTYFLNPQDNKRRQASDSGGERFVGVGITISNRAPFTVQSVVAGGPADRAGVQAGDAITAVDGTDTSNLSLDDLSKRLRNGEAGSTVVLGLKRAGGASQDVTIKRAEIVQPAIESRLMPGGIGYIALHNFSDAYARFSDGRNIEETLDAALQSFEQAGVEGWVFDVRGNPGGSEQTLAEVAGRFQPDGLVLVSIDRQGHAAEAPVDGHLFSVQRPLAVLIDGQSGSASELFAATMKEYGRARLFGQRTAGAVNGALETELSDGAALQFTVVEGRTGKERKLLDGVGVSPDETVGGGGSAAAVLGGRSDPQYTRAMQWVVDQASKQPTLPLKAASTGGTLPATEVRAKLQPVAAVPDDVPAGPARAAFGDLVLTHPNELAIGIAGDAKDAAAFAQTVRGRHWQGGYEEFFGTGAPSPYIVETDLYADTAGAASALNTNDYPYDLKVVAAPAKLGDGTVAYTGYDAADGSSQIVWRRGRVVYTVQYTAQPGVDAMTPALDAARKVDARAATTKAP